MEELMIHLLNDTVDYYSKDTTKRAIREEKSWFYDSVTGNKNSIGRYMLNPKKYEFMHREIREAKTFSDKFPEEFRGIRPSFWQDIQYLHDEDRFWNKKRGLSKMGRWWVEKMLNITIPQYCSSDKKVKKRILKSEILLCTT